MQAKSFQRYAGLGIFLLFTLSCALFSAPPMEPAPVTQVASLPTPSDLEEASPQTEPASSAKLPNGIVTEENGLLTLFDRDGYTMLQIEPPYVNASNLHIAGDFQKGSVDLPIIYYAFEQNNSILFYNNGQTTTLKAAPLFAGLVGATGYPLIAYTTAEFADDALISNLYAGSPESLPTSEALISDLDPQGWALSALALDVKDAQISGVWYAKQPWGIGGDIVYQPRRTLSYLDISTGAAYQYLGADINPSALSADRQWVAYTSDPSVEAGGGAMSIRNFLSGENISFPLVDAVDQRGAGEASFSPNNQYLAWMEASGWQMSETPNFHSLVRVGNLNGDVIAQFADTAFLSVSGLASIQRVQPVGWFDDNTLVVMARGEYWDDSVMILIDIPSQAMRLLARGTFVDFIYLN